MFRGSQHRNGGAFILWLRLTNSQFNNRISNKKTSTAYTLAMIEEIKPFVFVYYYNKIEPEEAEKKKPENSYFLLVSLFLIPAGWTVFVLPILGEKLACLLFWRGLNEIQILQVVKQQYCNCLIALSGHSRSSTWNWFTAKHSPREDRRIYFPLVCVSHHHQKNYSRLSMGE